MFEYAFKNIEDGLHVLSSYFYEKNSPSSKQNFIDLGIKKLLSFFLRLTEFGNEILYRAVRERIICNKIFDQKKEKEFELLFNQRTKFVPDSSFSDIFDGKPGEEINLKMKDIEKSYKELGEVIVYSEEYGKSLNKAYEEKNLEDSKKKLSTDEEKEEKEKKEKEEAENKKNKDAAIGGCILFVCVGVGVWIGKGKKEKATIIYQSPQPIQYVQPVR